MTSSVVACYLCVQEPEPSAVLGLFNLSQLLTEEKLRELLEKYGKLKNIMLIKDRLVHNTTHTQAHT